MPPASKTDDERAIAKQIETYRQGFLNLSPERIASIWDAHHSPLIYVAQEMREPRYGWEAIRRYLIITSPLSPRWPRR